MKKLEDLDLDSTLKVLPKNNDIIKEKEIFSNNQGLDEKITDDTKQKIKDLLDFKNFIEKPNGINIIKEILEKSGVEKSVIDELSKDFTIADKKQTKNKI